MSRSPITTAKNAQGYVAATERKRCASCQHMQKTGADSLQCRRGGYLVTMYAVCDRWEIKQPPGFRPATN